MPSFKDDHVIFTLEEYEQWELQTFMEGVDAGIYLEQSKWLRELEGAKKEKHIPDTCDTG